MVMKARSSKGAFGLVLQQGEVSYEMLYYYTGGIVPEGGSRLRGGL